MGIYVFPATNQQARNSFTGVAHRDTRFIHPISTNQTRLLQTGGRQKPFYLSLV